jgi:DNA-binding IclR family transcriptional regulator
MSLQITRLSRRGLAILRTVAAPLAAGFSASDIAKRLGISSGSTYDLLDELRRELKSLATLETP